MIKEAHIVYERGDFWVLKCIKGINSYYDGFAVYQNGFTHSIRRAIIGFQGQEGLDRAIKYIKRFEE